MSEIVENLEKTLLSINVEGDYSREDIDCIIDGMKNLVKIVKIIHIRSSDTRKKLDENELYIKHLENRLHMLESADRSTAGVDVMDVTGGPSHDSHEECRLDPILWLEDIDSDESDNMDVSGNDKVRQPTQSQPLPDLESRNTIPPPPPPPRTDCPIPDVQNFQKDAIASKNDFTQYKQYIIEETCRRTVLWSNLPPQIVETIKNRKESFYPLLKTSLKAYDLELILDDSKKVTIVGKSLKIEYLDTYRAGYIIRRMRNHIGLLKQESREWGADHPSIVAAQNIRFTRLTAAKYHKQRKTLEALAKQLKRAGKINFFDIFVLKNKIYLRTCWKRQEMIQNSTLERPFINKRVFTYYDEVLAKKILSGEVPVDERDARVQNSRHILSSGLGVDYAREDDYIYGGIPEP